MTAAPDLAERAASLGRLAAALGFICGPEHPATVATRLAAADGSAGNVKKAHEAFKLLAPRLQRAALTMMAPAP